MTATPYQFDPDPVWAGLAFLFHIIVAVLGWAFWKMNDRKDAAIRDLYEQVAELSRVQTAAITKMESALVALKDAVDEMKEPRRGRQDSAAAE